MNKTKFFSSLLVAALFATTSVFTSCKDYDDDIKNLQSQIDGKSPVTALTELKTSLEAKLTALESTLNAKEAALKAEINKKADQSALDALTKTVEDLTAQITAINTKIDAIDKALENKADKEALEQAVTVLTGKIEDEAKAREDADKIIEESIKLQEKALTDYKAEIAEKLKALGITDDTDRTSLGERIGKVEDALKDFVTTGTFAELKSSVQKLAETIDKNVAGIDVLEAFVQKQLTSLVLKPAFYWEGLEGIEVPCGTSPLFKVNDKDYKFKYKVTNALGQQEVSVTVKGYMGFDATIYDKKAKAKGTYFLNSEVEVGNDKYGFWDIPNFQGVAGPINLDSEMARTRLAKLLEDGKIDGAKTTDQDRVLPTMVDLMQGGIATYHYNPSTADLEGYNVKFYENDAEVYTRSARTDSILATPYETTISKASNQYNTYENGILTVPFKVDAQTMGGMFRNWVVSKADNPIWDGNHEGGLAQGYDRETENLLPFIALQLSKTGEKGDTIVTSDYGVVVPAMIQIIALADNAPLEKINGKETNWMFNGGKVVDNGVIRANHLYESVGYNDIVIPESGVGDNYGAITMPATHEIVYTEKAFNLEQFIETHVKYTNFARYGRSDTKDRLMTAAEMEALGLHYEYTLVDYLVGNEKTSQTKHLIRVDKDGNPSSDVKVGYFSVRSVDDQGETMVNEKATQETIGREPLIRVTLVDKDGNIVRYGYIKLRIAQSAAVNEYVQINLGEMYMNCGEEKKVTWAQMENILLRKLDMTKQDFEKNYYLDVVGGYKYMPHDNPAAGEKDGTLYNAAGGDVQWQAKGFYPKDAGKKEF